MDFTTQFSNRLTRCPPSGLCRPHTHLHDSRLLHLSAEASTSRHSPLGQQHGDVAANCAMQADEQYDSPVCCPKFVMAVPHACTFCCPSFCLALLCRAAGGQVVHASQCRRTVNIVPLHYDAPTAQCTEDLRSSNWYRTTLFSAFVSPQHSACDEHTHTFICVYIILNATHSRTHTHTHTLSVTQMHGIYSHGRRSYQS